MEMTFSEWFDELEGYGLRSERLLASVPDEQTRMVIALMKIAFEVGYDEGVAAAGPRGEEAW